MRYKRRNLRQQQERLILVLIFSVSEYAVRVGKKVGRGPDAPCLGDRKCAPDGLGMAPELLERMPSPNGQIPGIVGRHAVVYFLPVGPRSSAGFSSFEGFLPFEAGCRSS